MSAEPINRFYLVGRTALALYLGHRKSVDIDLFSHDDFEAQELAFYLEQNIEAQQIETGKNLVRCFISSIKIEFISHKYPLLNSVTQQNEIRISSIEDICAFKLNAVVNRGSKKDFWDIAYLLDKFELNQIIDFYKAKYKNANFWQVEKSLCYFNDADEELVEIMDLNKQSWESIKNIIRKNSKDSF